MATGGGAFKLCPSPYYSTAYGYAKASRWIPPPGRAASYRIRSRIGTKPL
jgi:hypothetical protein